MINSVDDYGDAKYVRLEQKVPDGYVYDLQTDLRTLGFVDVGNPDGAFGEKTRKRGYSIVQLDWYEPA